MSQPISLGIVVDTSGSMGGKLHLSRELVAQAIHTTNPRDEFLLVQASDLPLLFSGLSANAGEVQSKLAYIQSKGRSALLDSISLALQEMKNAGNSRKVLLVISDGEDNSSRSTLAEIHALIRDSGVQIYPIGFYWRFGTRTVEPSGPGRLHEIAEQSGGRHFAVNSRAELLDVIAEVTTALRSARQ